MDLPPPSPVPAAPNRVASVALVLGVAAVVGGALLGVFMLRLSPLAVGGLALLLAAAAITTGTAGIVASGRRRGQGLPAAIIAIVLGLCAFAALAMGRIFGAEVLGLTTWG